MQKMRSLFFVFLMTVTVTGFSQVKINVKSGHKYKVETESEVKSVASIMGQEMENNAETKTTTVYEIGKVGTEETSLVATITNMKVKATAMGQETKFDSDDKDNSPGTEDLAATINKPNNITMGLKGNILKQDNEFKDPLGGIGMDNGTIIEFAVPAVIGKQLKEGDSFPYADSTVAEKKTVHNSGTYTVTKISDDGITISYAGTATISGVMEQMGQEMNTATTLKVMSEIKMNPATGIINESSSTTDGTMTIEAAGMSIPVTIKTKTKSKVSLKD